jgi:hypothetical protein
MARKGPRPGRAIPKASISIQIPVTLLDAVNTSANELGISRAKWFELVAKDALQPVEKKPRRQILWGAELAS